MNANKKKILEVLRATPELREDKIAAIKKAIAEGTYQIKAECIADKMLRETLFELALSLKNDESLRKKNN